MKGVRLHHRLPVKLPVQIVIAGEAQLQCEAQLLDMSAYGLGLRTPQEMKPGAPIQVKWDKFCFSGIVRHCRKQWKGYHSQYDNYRIGVLLQDPLDERDLDDIASGAWRKSIFSPASAAHQDGPAAGPSAL